MKNKFTVVSVGLILISCVFCCGCSTDDGGNGPKVEVNDAPEIEILVDPDFVFEDEEYDFLGIGSDPDGEVVLYQWDFDGDGIFDWASNITGNVTYTYTETGIFNVTFKVTDDKGGYTLDSIEIHVYARMPPSPPIIRIENPKDGDTLNGTINVSGFANPDDNRVNILSIEVKIDDGSWMIANYTFFDTYPNVKWFIHINTTNLINGKHKIFARTIDDEFGTSEMTEDFIEINVENN